MIDGAILIAPSPDVIFVDLPVVVVTAQGTAPGLHVVGCDGVPRVPARAAAGAVPHELGSAALTMLLALIGSGSDGPRARKAPPLQWQSHCGPV